MASFYEWEPIPSYVVQLFVPDYTWSIIIALPMAFAVTFAVVW